MSQITAAPRQAIVSKSAGIGILQNTKLWNLQLNSTTFYTFPLAFTLPFHVPLTHDALTLCAYSKV